MNKDWQKLWIAVLTAALLWFYMFSPWTHGAPNFWLVMSFSAVTLTSLGLGFTPDRETLLKVERPLLQVLYGIAIAFALWGIFWLGDKASSWLFGFARGQVDSVYSMRSGLPLWLIGLLLLFLIGRLIHGKRAADLALIVTALVYALVHIWSFNFMLVMAALVAGLVWGLIYRLNPKLLPALVVSHALWDVLVFIVFPI